MKRLMICLFLLALVCSASLAFAGNFEFLADPGFETTTVGSPWYNQAAWGACSGAISTSEFHGGAKSWQTTGAAVGAIDCVEQTPKTLIGALTYKCSYWVKVPTASAVTPAKVDIRAWFGTVAPNDYIVGFWSAGGASGLSITDSNWHQVTDAGVDVPAAGFVVTDPRVTQVYFRCRVTSLDPTMVAYIDDASISGSAHKVSGKVVDGSGNPVAGAPVYFGATNPPDTSAAAAATSAADGTFSVYVPDGSALYFQSKAFDIWSASNVVAAPASTTDQSIANLVIAKRTDLTIGTITGKLVDSAGNPLSGKTVSFASVDIPGTTVTATSNASGIYTKDFILYDPVTFVGGPQQWNVSAGGSGSFTTCTPASQTADFSSMSDPYVINLSDFVVADIVRNFPKESDLLFSLITETLPSTGAIGAWPIYQPRGASAEAINAPNATTDLDGLKWEVNTYATGNGYRVLGPFNDVIPVNGVTAVAVVQPKYIAVGGESRGEVIDVFYSDLFIAVSHAAANEGEVQICWRGYQTENTGYKIPDGQKTVLVLSVKPNGDMKLYANGNQVWTKSTNRDYTQLVPTGFKTICVGRNDPDGWSTFSGNIGDVLFYKTRISNNDINSLLTNLGTKFGISTTALPAEYTVTASADANSTISPAGENYVLAGESITFNIAPKLGYGISEVLVDGVNDPGAVAAKIYTFSGVAGNHTIAVSSYALPQSTVSGKVMDKNGNGIAGATVYFSGSPNASLDSTLTTVTNGDGTFTKPAVPNGTVYVSAVAAGYWNSPDAVLNVAGDMTGVNIVIAVKPATRNIPAQSDMFFGAVTESLPVTNGVATGNWPTVVPAGGTLNQQGAPKVAYVDNIQWEKNLVMNGDGFELPNVASGVAANGATAVAVVKPVYVPGNNDRGEIISLYYHKLTLSSNKSNGHVLVSRGRWNWEDTGYVLPENQKTVLTLAVAADGSYTLYANGVSVKTDGAWGDFTTLSPVDAWMTRVGVGRNPWDGWSSFNGNIGDVFVYSKMLSNADINTLQADLGDKFGIACASLPNQYTIHASGDDFATITPAGDTFVNEGGAVTYTITTALGYGVSAVLIDGTNDPDAVASKTYTFSGVNANHQIQVISYEMPTFSISGKVTDKSGVGIGGANVYISGSTNSSQSPLFTVTTDSEGNYTKSGVPAGTIYVSAAAYGYWNSPDTVVALDGNKTGVDIALAVRPTVRNIPAQSDLLFSAVTESFSSSTEGDLTGAWMRSDPAGVMGSLSLETMSTPTVGYVGNIKWEKNNYSDGDGYRYGANITEPIPVNGATIVAVVKPKYRIDGGWGSVFNAFYNDLMLNVEQTTGNVWINRKGQGYAANPEFHLQDGQTAILSAVVQPDGQIQVYVNGGAAKINVTETNPYTQITPGGWDNGTNLNLPYAHEINVGRNAPDGWSTFNGNLGDIFVYKKALSSAELDQIHADLSAKFGIATEPIPVFTTISGQVTDGTNGVANITLQLMDLSLGTITTTTTGTDGSYTFNTVASGEYQVTVVPSGGYTVNGPAMQPVSVATDPVTGINFTLTAPTPRVIPNESDLLFAAFSEWLPESGLTGDWSTYAPAGGILDSVGTPMAINDGSSKWEQNLTADGEGFIFKPVDEAGVVVGGEYQAPIATTGVSVVAVVQPAYLGNTSGEARGEIVSMFYSELFLAISHRAESEGHVIVNSRGYKQVDTGFVVPNGQKTILSLVVQTNGDMTLYANGAPVWFKSTGMDYSTLQQSGLGGNAKHISVGYNGYDGWSAFNGQIGDVFVYKTALSKASREALQADLAERFGVGALTPACTLTINVQQNGSAAAADVALYKKNGAALAPITLKAVTGSFSLEVAPGDYYVSAYKNAAFGSANITVNADASVTVNMVDQGSAAMIDLKAKDLTDGNLAAWQNLGYFGGQFDVTAGTPVVGEAGGHKAVTFGGNSAVFSNFYNPIIGKANFTMSTWVYAPAAPSAENPIVSIAPMYGGEGVYTLFLNYGSDTGWGLADWGWEGMGTNSIPAVGEWHHIAVSYNNDADTATIYVDNNVAATNAALDATILDGWKMMVGGGYYIDGGIDFFNGSVASVEVYPYAKDAAAIAELFNNKPWPVVSGPVYGVNNKTCINDNKLTGKRVKVWGKIQSIVAGSSYVISDGYSVGVTINGSTSATEGDMVIVTGTRNADGSVTP